MRSLDIVDHLLEAETPLPDAAPTKLQLRRLFKPGTQWQRVNHRFVTKVEPPIPAGQPVTVTVAKQQSDAIVFILPGGEGSYLAYPDAVNTRAEFVAGGVDLVDRLGTLLSYRPV